MAANQQQNGGLPDYTQEPLFLQMDAEEDLHEYREECEARIQAFHSTFGNQRDHQGEDNWMMPPNANRASSSVAVTVFPGAAVNPAHVSFASDVSNAIFVSCSSVHSEQLSIAPGGLTISINSMASTNPNQTYNVTTNHHGHGTVPISAYHATTNAAHAGPEKCIARLIIDSLDTSTNGAGYTLVDNDDLIRARAYIATTANEHVDNCMLRGRLQAVRDSNQILHADYHALQMHNHHLVTSNTVLMRSVGVLETDNAILKNLNRRLKARIEHINEVTASGADDDLALSAEAEEESVSADNE